MKKFKPNLVPNEPKDGSFSKEDRDAIINGHGGIEDYIVFHKKDGCRLEFGVEENILTRSLKQPGSDLVKERFDAFQKLCLSLNIIVEGEFYMHGLKFNEIFRFFSKSDVTDPGYVAELEKMKEKKPEAFFEKYRGKDIPFLTTFHEDLRFWAFDFIILDRPDLVGFKERWVEAYKRIMPLLSPEMYVVMPTQLPLESIEVLDEMFDIVLDEGWEGLILTHKNHVYKYGRSTIKSGTILKLKDDKQEFDGIVLDVEEATMVKEGVDKTINELGRSKTSKKKDDRLPSGLAKGFVVEFEGLGTFTVGLRGFDNDAKRELLLNKKSYIGRHFKYSGMPPVKDFPRSVYFDCWRDEK